MSSILSDIESTLINSDKETLRHLYKMHKDAEKAFEYVRAVKGKKYAYLKPWSIRGGIRLSSKYANLKYIGIEIQSYDDVQKTYTIPDWLEFKVDLSMYTKEHGYKPIVIMRNPNSMKIRFSTGSEFKEFENCIIKIINYPEYIHY